MLYQCVATVTAKEEIAPHIYQFIFTLTDPPFFNFLPGQYVLMQIPSGFRQYSISSAPSDNTRVETIVDISPLGGGSQYLLQLHIGDTVNFRAPAGVFILKDNQSPKIFLATGTGITPLKSMLMHLSEKNSMPDSHLLWGLREQKDVYLTSLWDKIHTKHSNFLYHLCLSRQEVHNPHYFSGRMQDCLVSEVTPEVAAKADWYLCGRPAVVESLVTFIQEKYSVPKDRFFHEKYT